MSFTARDVDRHMRKIGPYVDWSQTCDGFKSGDPDTVVEGVAVSWMAGMAALRQAHARGCNLFITHEPTFYSHMEDDPAYDEDRCTREKRGFLEETHIVVYRCHDVWDRYPGQGILDSWAGCLGLTAVAVAGGTYMRVVPIEPVAAGALARETARRLQPFGQQAVQLVGDPEQQVARLGIGTGAIASIREYHRLGADAGIVTELMWWRDARWAWDMRMPLLVVDHTVSEEPGLKNLAAHLAGVFRGVPVEYLPTNCAFQLICGQ